MHINEDATQKDDAEKVDLSIDDIKQWQQELLRWIAAKAEAETYIAEYRKKLRAAIGSVFGTSLPAILAILGKPDYEELLGDPQESLRAGISRVLRDADGPMTHDAVRAKLRKIPRFDQLLEKHEGGYYHVVVTKLVREGEIRRVGKNLLARAANEPPSEANPESSKPQFSRQ